MKKITIILLAIICGLTIAFYSSYKSEAPLTTHSIIKSLKDSLRLPQ